MLNSRAVVVDNHIGHQLIPRQVTIGWLSVGAQNMGFRYVCTITKEPFLGLEGMCSSGISPDGAVVCVRCYQWSYHGAPVVDLNSTV